MRWMRCFLLVVVVAVVSCSREDAPEVPFSGLEPFEGVWSGDLEVMGQTLPLVLRVDADATEPVTLDSPSQNAFSIPAESAQGADGVLSASWPSLRARYSGTLSEDGAAIEGKFRQNGLNMTLNLVKLDAAEAPLPGRVGRPQEPDAPLPYASTDVLIGGDPQLAGTLTMPEGEGPFPGVVLITGSGPQNRNEELLGHRPFLVLSDRLTRAGIAVLRYDERGVGESEGEYPEADLHDFADDAARAMAFLREQGEVSRVGFVGHSEGGMVAALVAQQADDQEPDFIVALAAPFLPFDEIVEGQVRDALTLGGAPEDVVVSSVAMQRSLLDAAMTGDHPEEACTAIDQASSMLPQDVQMRAQALCAPAFFSTLRLSPEEIYSGVGMPFLALFGSLDSQVPAESNAAAARGLLGEGALVEIVDGANHLFQTAETGAVAEYSGIEETMREDVMARIAEFVNGQ